MGEVRNKGAVTEQPSRLAKRRPWTVTHSERVFKLDMNLAKTHLLT